MQGLQVWFNIWKLASMIYQAQIYHLGFPGGSVVKNLPANAWEEGLISRWGKMLWTKNCQSTPVFLPRESHWQKSLVGYSP